MQEQRMDCKNFEDQLILYHYDELPAEERAALESHLAACSRCRDELEKARHLNRLLNSRRLPEASPELLIQCRQGLDEALDREEFGWRGILRGWLGGWPGVPVSGAAAALILVALGFGLGWTLHARAPQFAPVGQSGASAPSFADLSNSRISGISQVSPNPQTGQVRITLDAQRRVTLEGSLDDPHIQQVLVYAVKNYDNPGIRRDTLDALRARPDNPRMRQALLYALGNDANPGVRLEALAATESMDWTAEVRQAVVQSLKHDRNDGVRVAATNALVRHANHQMLPLLEQLARNDPNDYVRLKCAAAVQELVGDDF